jgi:bZIP transcription factor
MHNPRMNKLAHDEHNENNDGEESDYESFTALGETMGILREGSLKKGSSPTYMSDTNKNASPKKERADGVYQHGMFADDKRLRRVMANRRSAKESRERRKQLLTKLQSGVDVLHSENQMLRNENGQLRETIQDLRQQLSYAKTLANMHQSSGISFPPSSTVGGLSGSLTPLDVAREQQQLMQQQQQQLLQQQMQSRQQQLLLGNQHQMPQGMLRSDLQLQYQQQQDLLLKAALQRVAEDHNHLM